MQEGVPKVMKWLEGLPSFLNINLLMKKQKIVAIALTSIENFTILCYNTICIYVFIVGGLRKWLLATKNYGSCL